MLSALMDFSRTRPVRMHIPGHKGIDPFALDFTELPPTGDLYRDDREDAPIRQAEAGGADVFGADVCCFLTGGSSQGIAAALAALTEPGGRILLDRCYHTAFTHAMAMLDLHPLPLARTFSPSGLCLPLPPADLDSGLRAHPDIKTVCITSPTYYGVLSDIPALADVCRRRNARLFVDAAHGAHFPWAGLGHPAQGADLFVCSAHKTLPALGQAALLFGRATGPEGRALLSRLRRATSWFGTASPSYLLMASIDAAFDWLQTAGTGRWAQNLKTICNLRAKYDILSQETAISDPFRITARVADWGYSGHRAAEIWQTRFNLWPELADARQTVCVATAADGAEEFAVLDAALEFLFDNRRPPLAAPPMAFPPTRRVCSPRTALLGPSRPVRLDRANGLTAAEDILLYPPGIPLCAAGQAIDAPALTAYGLPPDRTVSVRAG